MSIQRLISIQDNEYFSSDYNLEVPKCSDQDLVDQQLQYSSYMETCLPIASSSSSSIISCIGSPSSAFFATERCLELTQHDDDQDNISELIKNYDLQQCKNGILEDSLAQAPEPDFRHKISLPSFIRTEFSTSPFSDVSYQRHPSLSFDGNQDYCFSHDLCCSQLTNTRQQSASPSLTCHNSASSGVSHKPSKTRIRWSEDLHDRFLECVNRLGGADKATPKQILNLMDSESLTLDHVKSHLQKYRNAKHPESTGKSEKRNSTDAVTDIESKTGIEIKEALKMQLEVQRCLHEQLETQRTLQMRIEEQAKKLKMILDQQQKTTRTMLETRNSNISSPGVEIFVVEDSDT